MEDRPQAEYGDDDGDIHADPQAPDTVGMPVRMAALPESAQLPWRAAHALLTLRDQVDAAYPGRSKASDGMLGDARHRNRTSDHNPHIVSGGVGVVTAIDITHDPAHGCDAGALVKALHAARDPRVKYIIWNSRIANAAQIGAAPPWTWRAYTGSNPHNRHCHISIKAEPRLYDDTSAWPVPPSAKGMLESNGLSAGANGANGADAAEDAFNDIAMALCALSSTNGRPLLEALVDAQEAITVLLSRHATETAAGKEIGALEASRPTFDALRGEYMQLFQSCQIRAARAGEVGWHRQRLLRNRSLYEQVASATGAPWWFIGIVHALEASFNLGGHLHNGDPLSSRTVHVPKGRPMQWLPPNDWVASAIDAITYENYSRQDDWSVARALYRFEAYNGFGYHGRDMHSPYLWSFSNHYTQGKFVADGKFDPTAVSKQCGAAVMLRALAEAGDITLPA